MQDKTISPITALLEMVKMSTPYAILEIISVSSIKIGKWCFIQWTGGYIVRFLNYRIFNFTQIAIND